VVETLIPAANSPALSEEARLFGRHILGSPGIDGAAAARYAEGCAKLFAGPEPRRELALVAFAVRRPWALPFLDAACGLVAPHALLRRKLLLLLAVLEATTTHVAAFTPSPQPRWRLLLGLACWGLLGAGLAVVGLCLLPWARRAP